MIVEHTLKFWNKETFNEATDYLLKDKYKDKKISGNILVVIHSLVDIIPSFNTYRLCTKAGLIKCKKYDFANYEQFDEILTKLEEEESKEIWGQIIIEM